ncbi:hypothetical protein IAU59_007603 [Kwoniella sp. CBS 9459]
MSNGFGDPGFGAQTNRRPTVDYSSQNPQIPSRSSLPPTAQQQQQPRSSFSLPRSQNEQQQPAFAQAYPHSLAFQPRPSSRMSSRQQPRPTHLAGETTIFNDAEMFAQDQPFRGPRYDAPFGTAVANAKNFTNQTQRPTFEEKKDMRVPFPNTTQRLPIVKREVQDFGQEDNYHRRGTYRIHPATSTSNLQYAQTQQTGIQRLEYPTEFDSIPVSGFRTEAPMDILDLPTFDRYLRRKTSHVAVGIEQIRIELRLYREALGSAYERIIWQQEDMAVRERELRQARQDSRTIKDKAHFVGISIKRALHTHQMATAELHGVEAEGRLRHQEELSRLYVSQEGNTKAVEELSANVSSLKRINSVVRNTIKSLDHEVKEVATRSEQFQQAYKAKMAVKSALEAKEKELFRADMANADLQRKVEEWTSRLAPDLSKMKEMIGQIHSKYSDSAEGRKTVSEANLEVDGPLEGSKNGSQIEVWKNSTEAGPTRDVQQSRSDEAERFIKAGGSEVDELEGESMTSQMEESQSDGVKGSTAIHDNGCEEGKREALHKLQTAAHNPDSKKRKYQVSEADEDLSDIDAEWDTAIASIPDATLTDLVNNVYTAYDGKPDEKGKQSLNKRSKQEAGVAPKNTRSTAAGTLHIHGSSINRGHQAPSSS